MTQTLPQALPIDTRVMVLLANGMSWLAAALLLAGVGVWLVRHPALALQRIEIAGDLQHQNEVTLRAHMASQLRGNFLTLDLAKVKAVMETVPWVRQAVVERVFPNRIRITLEEHQAVARWTGEAAPRLVNNRGDVFDPSADVAAAAALPGLGGPEGQSARVWAAYQQLGPLLSPLGLRMTTLQLSPQGGWRATLGSGAKLELGRGEPAELAERLQRFVQTLPQVTAKHSRRLEAADLRYPSGYAVRLHGVTTGELPAAAPLPTAGASRPDAR